MLIARTVCYYKYCRNLVGFKAAKIKCNFRKQQVNSKSGELDVF